jgi:hypothetical protein
MLAAFDGALRLVVARGAFKAECNLLCGFCLLVENGLRLTAKT